jgi:hypothetical protein
MINLAQHIEALLLANDCVIVPGFGGFITHYVPAIHVKEENLFLPPSRAIGFNPQLKLNDGVLVQSYMSAYDSNFADATRMIEKEVKQLVELLHREGLVQLENIGEIRYNIYGSYEFSPYENKITTPSLYGLDSFEIQELSALQPEPVQPTAPKKEEKKSYEIHINRTYLRNAVAAAVAILLFFTFSTPIQNTNTEKYNYAQLLPEGLLQQIEKPVREVVPTTPPQQVQHPRTGGAMPLRDTIAHPRTTIPVEKVNKPTQPERYHIIVASGISTKRAEKMVSQLQDKGFANAKIVQSKGKIRVAICSFSNRRNALNELLTLRKKEAYQYAWLLTTD